jgi:hypothetical protein
MNERATALNGINPLRPPVAIAFLRAPPARLPRIERVAAAGCAFWKYASDGHALYSTAEDHYNCPVDAFTHGAELPPDRANELRRLIGTNDPAAVPPARRGAGHPAAGMELVDGEDLSQRLARGAIPIDEALPFAKQIAEALDAAHERGIPGP